MNKKTNFSKHPILTNPVSYAVLLAMLGIAGAVVGHNVARRKAKQELTNTNVALYKNQVARKTYLATATEFAANAKIQQTIDSIGNRNDDLLGIAFDKYFTQLDKKYTIGKFLDPDQIAHINHVLSSHISKNSKSDDIVYKYVKSCMPMTAATPLRVFEDVVGYLDIVPSELIPYGVEFDNGEIFQFYNGAGQHLFYKYMKEYESAYATDDEPNFDMAELAPVRREYVHNNNQIFELEKQIERNDSIIQTNLARFDAERDSLNDKVNKLRQKLK